MTPDLQLIVAQGTRIETGRQIGEQTAGAVHANVELYLQRFLDQAQLDRTAVRRLGEAYGEVVAEFSAPISQMLAGLAEGASVPLWQIHALNARTELLLGRNGDQGCTSLAVLPQHTAGNELLVAQNWDWHPSSSGTAHLLATKDESGQVVLALTEPGMLAKSGLNSSGVAVCANLLASSRDRLGTGVPYHALLRSALEAPRLSTAIGQTMTARRTSSGNVLLAAEDHRCPGEAIDLELAPDHAGVILPSDGLIAHANHFESPVPFSDLRASGSSLTLLRAARVRHLLGRDLHARSVTAEKIGDVLRDHFSHPDGLCRHVADEAPWWERAMTCHSIIMKPASREVYVSNGPPCENPYQRWSLDDLFTSAPSTTAAVPAIPITPGD